MIKHVIVGNFGDESIALLQWAIESKLRHVCFVTIKTGWGAKGWEERVLAGQAYAESQGIGVIYLSAPIKFLNLVIDRKEFPSATCRWCASFLKGVPLNNWLDEIDPTATLVILLAKRRSASRLLANLAEFSEESEYFGTRKVWHPLYKHSLLGRNALIQRANFQILGHRSLECDPCIHATREELSAMHEQDKNKLSCAEKTINKRMFPLSYYCDPPNKLSVHPQNQGALLNKKNISYHERFAMGCGSPWGCGE